MEKIIRKSLFNQRGVTLIELIAVILILGIIAAVGVPVVFNQIEIAKTNTDATNIAIMNDAIERYALLNDGYPTTTEATNLATLISTINSGTIGGPFIRADFPTTKADGSGWTLVVSGTTVTGIQ